jgi:hypothetical protein
MTLDECIKECENVVKISKKLKRFESYRYNTQLAEWLKELKAWREGKLVQSANVNTETLIFNTEDLTSIPEIKSRPIGKWIEVLTKEGSYYECSECGHRLNWIDEDDNYCCKCGSKNNEGL